MLHKLSNFKLPTFAALASLATLASLFCGSVSAQAAQNIKIYVGLFGRTVTYQELSNFANTGETTPVLNFLFENAKATPEQAAELLNFPIEADLVKTSKLLNTELGVEILGRVAKAIHGGTPNGAIQALRGAIVLSTVGDNQLTLLEVIQNYPLRDMIVDAVELQKLAAELGDLLP